MRSTRARAEVLLALAALAALAAPGCADRLAAPLGTASDSPPARGGTLTLATFVRVRSLDPAVAFDEGADPVQRLLYARLVRVSRDGAFEPDLAESFELDRDGRRYVFRLRDGARFHDGTEVRAGDVKRSLERALHAATPCPAPSFYDHIAGYEAYHAGKAEHLEGIRVESDGRVSFELTEPDATFLAVLTLPMAAPVCASAGRAFDPSAPLPCGAGPFKLDRWEDRDALRLVRHEGYHGAPRPHLDAVRWLFEVPTTAQRFRFERGDIDMLHELGLSDSVAFRADPRWRPLGAWNRPRSTRGVFMNTQMEPFDRADVRRAVAAAIDRGALAGLRAGHLMPADRMVPAGVVGHDPSFEGQRHDLGAALEHMRRAGFAFDPSTGRGGYPFPIDYLVPVESNELQVAELFQQQLARVGIRIRLKALSWGACLALTGLRGRVRMGAAGWSADFDDPSDFFEPILSTAAIQAEASQNVSFFSDARLDALLARARREMDPAARKALYRSAELIVRDEAPWAIAYGYRYYDVWQPYVLGYRPHPMAFLEVGQVWLAEERRRLVRSARGAPPGSLNALALALSTGARR
jgi:ABC-type transport system substrate-binding protein